MTDTPLDTHDRPAETTAPRRGGAARPFTTADSFRAVPAAISPVRRKLYALLCGAGLADIADTTALISQELMTNAVMHGCREFPPDTEVTLTATYDGHRLRLSVHDPSDEQPCLRPTTDDQEGGRGLQVVAAYADRWGVATDSEGAGKSVWIELACPSPRHGEEGW